VANRCSGITENVTANQTMDAQLVSDMVGMGAGSWVRWQQKLTQIPPGGGASWTNSDQAVAACNANGINILYQLQSPPIASQNLDGLGSKATLSGAIGPGAITSIPINALNTEAFIPAGMHLVIGFGLGTAETVVTSTPTTHNNKYTGSGDTAIPINSFTLVNAHAVNEKVVEQGGFQFMDAAGWATAAGAVATRYNGGAQGIINAFQHNNEDYDSSNRIGNQVVTASWDGSSTWDNGGAIAAAAFSSIVPAVRAQIPNIPVVFTSIRRLVTTGFISGMPPCIQHGTCWTQGARQNLTGGVIPTWFDFHFYHGSDSDFDNTLVQDPLQSTYFDQAHTQVNSPGLALWISTLKNALSPLSPLMLCGEMGWDLYDDGSGQVFNLDAVTGALVANTQYSQFNVTALGHGISNGEPIWVDNNSNTLVETGLYSFGASALNATVVKITTDPRGNGTAGFPINQAKWTPAFNHAAGAQCYAQSTTDVVTPANAGTYVNEVVSTMSVIGGKAFYFTDLTSAVVAATPPFPATSNAIKSFGQTVNGVYTIITPIYQALQEACLAAGVIVMAALTTVAQGAPYIWMIPADQNGVYAPELEQNQVDQSGTGTAAQILLTLPAAVGLWTYLDGIMITGAPGTVVGSAELSITGLNSAFNTEIVNPIVGGEIYTLVLPKGRRATAVNTAIVVTLPAMAATSGKVAMTVLGHQQAS
jgi:hypothetical protein